MTRKEFNLLFEQYFDELRKHMLYHCGDKEKAGDFAQEAFIKIWERRKTIQKKSVKALLYTIGYNLYLSHYRHEQVKWSYEKSFVLQYETETPYDQLSFKELEFILSEAIEKMPESARVAFLMSRVDELSYKEIADRLNLSIKAVEKRMHVALKLLKETMNIYSNYGV